MTSQLSQELQDRATKYAQFGRVAWNLRAAVVDFLRGGDSNDDTGPDERIVRENLPLWEANAISSEIVTGPNKHATGRHKIAIDLDVPHAYVPSSTPGHGHLIVDVDLSWPRYLELLEHLSQAGVLEIGYVKAAAARGATWLRTPWTPKEQPAGNDAAVDWYQ
jgi:hypothetical protein